MTQTGLGETRLGTKARFSRDMKLSWEDRSAKVLASMENGKWHLRCMEGVNDQNDMYYGYVGIVCIHIRL